MSNVGKQVQHLLNGETDRFISDFCTPTMLKRFEGVAPNNLQSVLRKVVQGLPAPVSAVVPRKWTPHRFCQPALVIGLADKSGAVDRPRLILGPGVRGGVVIISDEDEAAKAPGYRPEDWREWRQGVQNRPGFIMYNQEIMENDIYFPEGIERFLVHLVDRWRRARPDVDEAKLFYPALLEQRRSKSEQARSFEQKAAIEAAVATPTAGASTTALGDEIRQVPMTFEEAKDLLLPQSAELVWAISASAALLGADPLRAPSRHKAIRLLRAAQIFWEAELAPLIGAPTRVEVEELAALKNLLSRLS